LVVVDATSIVSAVGGLKAAGDIIKGLFDLSTNAKIVTKVTELQRLIYDAQGSALAAQGDQFTLIQRIAELEQEIVRLKAWGAERENYELNDIGGGASAYVLKPDVKPAQPPHWLCTHCYDNHKKALLQPQGHGDGERSFQCPECKASLNVPYSQTPKDHAAHETWKRLGPGDECPRCRNNTLRTQSISLPREHVLVLAGLEIHQMKCSDCDFEVKRQKDPKPD
jgi:predicted nucleic-acid-binding Zn-ribbon protein